MLLITPLLESLKLEEEKRYVLCHSGVNSTLFTKMDTGVFADQSFLCPMVVTLILRASIHHCCP